MPDNRDAIAIVGMAGRFPGARDIGEFWRLLESGTEAIRFFSPDELSAAGIPESAYRDPAYVPANGYLEDAEFFDAPFFGMSPREAQITDPQHRIFLQCAWHALEDAAHVPDAFDGRIGVYAGCGQSTYLLSNLFRNPSVSQSVDHLQFLMGNGVAYLPTRVSYKLNLKGPSVSVNTACSTSLVAVHMACQSLLDYECDMALAGGASIQIPQVQGYRFIESGVSSPDGHCRAFDANAAGTVSGNGVGIVVLRRLADAVADGDEIRAVILGSAINNDGSDKVGYTAPSVEGQAGAIAEALSVADVDPETIHYVETHGTGTHVGDPIEIRALTRAFGSAGGKKTCAIGSVKTNVGHLDEAAGVTGLIKAVLALQNGKIPASLYFESPNPEIDFESGPFFVNDRLRDWPGSDGPRRAAVSSFGIGGTNAHVVLEQAAPSRATASERSCWVLPFSADTETALAETRERLAAHLSENPGLSPADVFETLRAGRKTFRFRDYACGRTLEDLAGALSAPPASSPADASAPHALAFMFPGQGGQHVGMAAGLYASEPVFREELDRCVGLFGQLGVSLSILTTGNPGAGDRMAETELAHASIFSVEYALARLWMHWGITPGYLIGHSLGEYAAACLADVFSLEDAVRVVRERSRLMDSAEPGGMLSVPLSEADLRPLMPDAVDLAAVNGHDRCVVSGREADLGILEKRLAERDIVGRRLAATHAFHSRAMEPILPAFEAVMRSVSLSPPRIPVISNSTGKPLTGEQAADPGYWSAHLREPVRYVDGVGALVALGCDTFLEVGPSDTLTRMTQWLTEDAHCVASLPHPREDRSDVECMAAAAGRIWSIGHGLDWAAFGEGVKGKRVSLPGYAFARERHWVDAPKDGWGDARPATPAPANIDDWFFQPRWRKVPVSDASPHGKGETCLLFGTGTDLDTDLRQALEEQGLAVFEVHPGDACLDLGDRRFRIRPDTPKDYETLVSQCCEQAPDLVVHLWTGRQAPAPQDSDNLDLGFNSLLYFARALADRFVNPRGRWIVCSPCVQEITGREALSPIHATLTGIVGVVPQEYPGITCRLVDLDLTDRASLADQILAEAACRNDAVLSAWRDGERWTRNWAPLALPERAGSTPIEASKTYLVTGGLGSMGLAFAEYIGAAAPCRIVLTGRSSFPDRSRWKGLLDEPRITLDRVRPGEPPDDDKDAERTRRTIRRIEAIERGGSTVEYIQADVSQAQAMDRVRAHLRAQGGMLGGIVHAAGVLGQGLIRHKRGEEVARVFGSKVGAAHELTRLVEDFSPAFLVLCSSLSSVTPIVGQVDYAAANAFLDAYAASLGRGTDTRVVSIAWGFWQELGMIEGARADAAGKEKIEDEIARLGRSDAGVRAFARILQHATPSLVAVTPEGLPDRENEGSPHPWFDRIVRLGNEVAYLEGMLSVETNWAIEEHVVLGRNVLPGTAYLEIARAAASEILGLACVELREVYFLSPLVVRREETVELRVVLQKSDVGWAFSILSREDSQADAWFEHARGQLHDLPPEESARTEHDGSVTELSGIERGAFETAMSDFGPRWQNLVGARFGDGVATGEFRLPEPFADEVDRIPLHPALLDNATGFLKVREGNATALPFSYRSVRIRDSLPAHVFSHVRRKPSEDPRAVLYDVSISDPSGNLLVDIEGYALRAPVGGAGMRPDNAALALAEPGSLSTLHVAPAVRRDLLDDEVEVEIRATGLNFIEVLYALGMLPHDIKNDFPFGLECAGVINRSASSRFRPGDEVVAYANGCFKAFAAIPARQVAHKPGTLSMEQGATLPAAYMTAWHSLAHAGRLEPGERVLVHSAAGGVGLAAVHVARFLGGEVFATAGTEEKRDYLRSLGVRHTSDSRSHGFGADIMAATDGQGVDVVLNGLGEQFTRESLSVLRRYGRFVELGKRAIFADSALDLRPFERQLTFSAVDVGPDLPRFEQVWETVMGHIRSGDLPPLPLRSFPSTDPGAGFEYMAQGRHIGKVVFTFDSPAGLIDAISLPRRSGRPFSAIVNLAPAPEPVTASPDRPAPKKPSRTVASDLESDTERGVARIWSDLLGVDAIGRKDDFFNLNGDSLLAAQVISMIHRELGVKLPFSAIFDAPTVELLAREIETALGSGATDEIEEGVI